MRCHASAAANMLRSGCICPPHSSGLHVHVRYSLHGHPIYVQ